MLAINGYTNSLHRGLAGTGFLTPTRSQVAALRPAAGDLMATVNPDPIIVVNLSQYRCDAFLVERDRIRVLELPGLTMEEVQKQAQNLRSSRATGSSHMAALLEWLWDAAARSCLDALGFKDPVSDDNWPRVWWIPTGLLSQPPLHAAGRHVRMLPRQCWTELCRRTPRRLKH